ncbi:MAG: hypothetical protein B6V02_03935 [Thermoprotei archaeon ex4572_64]|nr:MAG: hypothetical protein B6V02_03935 [Thermoprotei archaeon ex4572_64]
MKIPKLLVSLWRIDELKEVINNDYVDVVDVKDPSRGSLGFPKVEVVQRVVHAIRNREVSIALGDVRSRSEVMSTIKLYVNKYPDVDYVKIGLEVNDKDEAISIIKIVKDYVVNSKIILVGYGDYKLIRSIRPTELINIAYKLDTHGVMIDTRLKNGMNILKYLSINELSEFTSLARNHGLSIALAGKLSIKHILKIAKLDVDVLGFRTAACSNGRLGKLCRDKIRRLKMTIIHSFKKSH